MNRAYLALAVVGLTVVACQDQQPAAPFIPDGPVFQISDGHNGGNPGFFFLAPIRRLSDDASVPKTGFNRDLSPVIEVYECAGTSAQGCVLPLGALKTRITKTTGTPLLNRILVPAHFDEYDALWDTRNLGLRSDRTYRIQVSVGGRVLGFADVDVVRTLKEAARVNRDDFVPLLANLILPIRFWVGNGALCTVDGVPCSSITIDLSQGGGIELVTTGEHAEHFKVDIPSGTQATFGGQPVTNVTFNLETCEGIDVDLPTFGPCLRVSTDFEASGEGELEFSKPVLVSMCVLNEVYHTPDETRQEGLITLHQQDGSLIRALPHADPDCGELGMNRSGWDWLKSLAARFLAPTPAHAATRRAMLHVGAGGETGVVGAKCGPAQSPIPGMQLTTSCPPQSPMFRTGPQPSATATVTLPKTVSEFQFALPAKMDYLNGDDANRRAPAGTTLPTAVKVTDWDGAPVHGARVTFTEPAIEGEPIFLGTAISDENGVAEILWTIREGSNTAVASGRGIAAQNNYPNATVKPFMPDISLPTDQQRPVALGTGRVTFLATGFTPMTPQLDQQNLLDGDIGGQGIGRFDDVNGNPDPDGTFFEFQDAQTFTVGTSGRLAQIKVPLINLQEATLDVTLQIVAVVNGVPDETHSLGEVAIPASAVSTNFADIGNPAAWATFDLTSLEIDVVEGQSLAFIVRSASTSPYLYNPEFNLGYAIGAGYRRNRAETTTWTNNEVDFGFQTFVIPN